MLADPEGYRLRNHEPFFTTGEILPFLRGIPSSKTTDTYRKLKSCYDAIRKLTRFIPKVGLVLGSGLGDFAESCVEIVDIVEYSALPDFPLSTVEGHKGRFVFGYIEGVPAVVMQGRVHYYEGYPMQDVVMPTRLMSMLGAQILMLTNASGGINTDFTAGDFMLITDHISCFSPNPLIGPNVDELGTRFPDMSEIYDGELRGIVKSAASDLDIGLKEGVYVQLTGPSFETPAEIRMLRTLGADAVGMSTSMEAVAARHAGMRVCGISCVANLACGLTDRPLTHAEVQESADKAAPRFKALVKESIRRFGKISFV
ncbi:MAG: purine-nucleoside phosphorylase [Ruminococcus sp.]|nr:purine-nucleoside phosphorylase [Ruminococcus sp.]